MGTNFSTSLFHPDPQAPEGQGRSLRAGDTITWHAIKPGGLGIEPPKPGTRIVTLAADPQRDRDGHCFPMSQDVPTIDGGTVWLSSFDVIGTGNYRIVVAGRLVEHLDGERFRVEWSDGETTYEAWLDGSPHRVGDVVIPQWLPSGQRNTAALWGL